MICAECRVDSLFIKRDADGRPLCFYCKCGEERPAVDYIESVMRYLDD